MSYNPIYHLLLYFVLLLSFPYGSSGQNYVIKNYSTLDGLPSNLTYQCQTDADGFLWIATNNGLTRFDGKNFKIFGTHEKIYGNEVIGVSKFGKGIIGFYFNGCFIRDENGFRDLTDNPINEILIGDHIFCEEIDTLLIVTTRHWIYYFNRSTIKLIKKELAYKVFPQKQKNGEVKYFMTTPLFINRVSNFDSLELSRSNPGTKLSNLVILFSLKRGWIYSFDRNTNTLNLLYDANQSIISCLFANDSTLYFSTTSGLSCVNIHTQQETKIITGTQINSVFENEDGTLWACSASQGIFRIKKKREILYKKSFQTDVPPVQCVFNLKYNQMLLGNKDGSYTHFSLQKQQTKYLATKPTQNRITDFHSYNDDFICFTDNYTAYNDGKKFDSLYCTKKVSDYNADTLLISTCWGTILFSLKSKKEVARIFDERSTTNLLTQKEKSFYIGTPTTLYFKKGIADSCIQIALEKKLPTKISALCEDSQHRIWVGTDGWGIYLLNDKQKVIKKIDKQNLLESDNVHTITIDIFQRIWIGTDKGITLLEESKQGFKPYKPFADFDLKNYEINCLLVREDTVYFATSNEFIVGVYDNIPKYRNLSVLIKNVYVNNKEVQIKKNTFHPDENNIKLNLECPLIDSDEKALFQYALIKNNTDTIWQKSSNTSMELYSLSPGTYTMLIKAEDPSVSKSKSNTIVWHFTITEYFYKTWWFYTLVIFAIFSILFGVYFFYNKQKQNRIQKELEADAKINELKLQGLLSQMVPIFCLTR